MATTRQEPVVAPSGDLTNDTQLSKEYDTPMGLAHTTMTVLKDRIKLHYDLASDYYLSLWGEHIHHGYYPTAESKAKDTKEVAQLNLIKLLLETAQLSTPPTSSSVDIDPPATASAPQVLRILDVGCGIGGTSRYLACNLGSYVTGITISGKQVEIARRLTESAVAVAKDNEQQQSAVASSISNAAEKDTEQFTPLGSLGGKVQFLELDAEQMGTHFSSQSASFDVVWISEALSHFPNKALFFKNASTVLKPGGKLVIADWFKAADIPNTDSDIKAIEDGMLLPPLCTQDEYVHMAQEAGLSILDDDGPKDISQDVKQTWDITWGLIQNPSLWAFALSQGRDGIAFLQAFRAMRRGYASGVFRYAVMGFVK